LQDQVVLLPKKEINLMPTINLYSTGATLEGASPTLTLNFTVELSEAATVTTNYYWSTLEGTALQGSDYFGTIFNTLTFAAGERIKTISITLNNDTLAEADESLFVNIFNTNNAPTAQLLASARGFITDTLTSNITASLSDSANVNVESLTLTGSANINGTGNFNNNNLTGNIGNNVLDSGFGNDSLAGSAGNDTLIGGSGNDTLDGGTGIDSMGGGAGNDLYIIDRALDVISTDFTTGEIAGSDVDTIQASINFELTKESFIENLTLVGSAIKGSGNDYNNLITGNSQANLLSGAGVDTLTSGSDTLIGMGGNDTLLGGDGNDVLDGGTGLNSLNGGTGNDVYVVTNTTDAIVEATGNDGGIDRVETASSYNIANKRLIENITLTGDKAVNATGNVFDNLLVGNDNNNRIKGGAGNDRLEGKGGLDTLEGGTGDDTYRLNENPWTPLDVALEKGNGGSDLVQVNADYTLGLNFERLQLLGNGDFSGYGNSKANSIEGNDGNNLLDGKGGADDLRGGNGNDTYILNDAVDRATEVDSNSTIGGVDTVVVDFEDPEVFILATNIENVTLASSALGSKVSNVDGNSINNLMTGNESANAFSGFAGSDYLIGGGGQDTLLGGNGNDSYEINIEDNDIIEETELTNVPIPIFGDNTNFTMDTIYASYAGLTPVEYTMTANVEKFYFGFFGYNQQNNTVYYFDEDADISVNGNASLNYIETGYGNDLVFSLFGNDTVLSGFGSDSIDGGLGNDSLNGEEGSDTLIGGEGNDTLNGGTGIDSLSGGNGDDVYVINTRYDLEVTPESLSGGVDRVDSSVSFQLLQNLENLTLTGSRNINGMGNDLNNLIFGNSFNNSIDGQSGDDVIDGIEGNDTLFGQAGNDTLIGGSGIDILLGQSGNDNLTGGFEADTMTGGLGDDTYDVQSSFNLIIENSGEGVDSVTSRIAYYTLTDDVENLVLVALTQAIGGIGNALDNRITGNSAANIIDGAAGDDTMAGVDGNDKYYVDSTRDSVIEVSVASSATSGEDIVFASVSGYTLNENVENLTLTGKAITGTGNSTDNRIFGNELNNDLKGGGGNDYLDGGIGNDTMSGGLGNDVYFVEVSGDRVVESAGAGIDRLVSLVSQTLAANVDDLSLLGLDSLQGIGNNLDNVLSGSEGNNVLKGMAGNDSLLGNRGADTLSGGSGNDTLTGGLGADFFDFITTTRYSASDFGSDLLKDFSRLEGDKIRLGKTTFSLSGLVGGNISNTQFASVAKEESVGTSTALIVHSQATGNLYFNSNGAAIRGDFLIAETSFKGLGNGLTESDFILS
jgi:Ca2+-binding RTX toxin-like protein